MLIGIDACKNPDRVFHAYNDKKNFTHEFILNGLSHANRILGQTNAFKPGEWEVIGQFNEEAGCHQAFVSPLLDVVVDDISIPQGEKIRIEESYKYSASETEQLWESTGLVEGSRWTNKKGDYGKLSFFPLLGFFFPFSSSSFPPFKPKYQFISRVISFRCQLYSSTKLDIR